jgi:glycosyltransferase involved in cell wall biosynthesis
VHPQKQKTVAGTLHWLIAARSAYPHGCGVTHDDMRRVLRTAEEFDLVWFYKLRTPNMFPCWAWSRSVVDVDDVPSTYERSFLNTAATATQRLATTIRVISWQRRDRLIGDRFTVLGVCSEDDKRYLNRLGITTPVHVIPNGFDGRTTVPVRRPATPPRIGFIGIFDYEPNRLGIQWFARECWPQIKRAIPGARLRLVGRYSDGSLKPNGADIDGLGWVDDVTEEMASWSAMVVPIHLGAGTRGKIAHAFSAKCPVISTSLGAYGYDVTNGAELSLADSASDFADACIKAILEPDSAEAMAARARQQFLTKWTWDAIQPRIWAAAEDCLRVCNQTTGASFMLRSRGPVAADS